MDYPVIADWLSSGSKFDLIVKEPGERESGNCWN